MSRFGKKMRRKITQSVRTACKFRYIVTYEYLEVKSQDDWKPTELNILWFRGHRTKSSIKPSWSIQIPNQITKTSTCTAKWSPPYSVELIVTLYKDISGSGFKKKDYMFVMEDICGQKRKKLAIFPCNLSTYVSMDGDTSDLEMEFKPLSKKVISAKCGLKIRCEFIKEGSAIDDDMQSNFSHMSEAEEFSRMSELTEVSDEDEYDGHDRYDDIPEAEEPNELDQDLEAPWQDNNDFPQENGDLNKEPSTDVISMKPKSKPYVYDPPKDYISRAIVCHCLSLHQSCWSKFVADMNSFEWKQVSMLRNPLSATTKKKRIADQLKEKNEMSKESKDDQPVKEPPSTTDFNLPDQQDKQLIKVTSVVEESDGEEDYFAVDDDDAFADVDEDDHRTTTSLSSFGKSRNGLRESLKETLKNVTSKTTKLRSLGSSMDEIKDLESKLLEKTNRIWDLEKENKELSKDNKELVIENNRLQDDVFNFQKQRDELQTEISELQILVEDLKIRLGQSEAEHKQLKEEEKELLARMNLSGWLCKRGIKGITGRNWRRRWFATDKSGRLYYYKQNNNSTPQGFIDLHQIITVQDLSEDKQDKNKASFSVVVNKRKYEFMARDTEEKQKWINALDYLRHWRNHTTKSLSTSKTPDEEDALNPFL